MYCGTNSSVRFCSIYFYCVTCDDNTNKLVLHCRIVDTKNNDISSTSSSSSYSGGTQTSNHKEKIKKQMNKRTMIIDSVFYTIKYALFILNAQNELTCPKYNGLGYSFVPLATRV